MLNSLKCIKCWHLHTNLTFANYAKHICATKLQNFSSVNYENKWTENEITSKRAHEKRRFPKIKHNYLTDKEYLVKLKNDPDQFGGPFEGKIVDEGDLKEEKYFTEQPVSSQKLKTKQYADIIKKLIKERKIKEAIDVVEVRMLKEDRVKPEDYLYNLLLGACGRVGYTKKAFMLYNQMKKRGLKIMGGTYTALFNACANSPWPTTDGLSRATHLYNIMIEKGFEPNDTNYNAMIKAFGRCGDLLKAFSLVDEMCSKGFKIKDDTINFLLQACISDKDAGFRHALLVWRTLINKKISPSVYTFNLMLRCIRDCGLGDDEITKDVVNKILSDECHSLAQNKHYLLTESQIANNIESRIMSANVENISDKSSTVIKHNENQIDNCKTNLVESIEQSKLRPNLMAEIPHLGNIIAISEVKRPEERLLLVGGCSGFLDNMYQHECTPDIKTITQLLDCIPSTMAAEKELIDYLKKSNIKPDTDFFNMLIKKRSMRFDYKSAKEVLIFFDKYKYKPDLVTYGVLALGCKTKEEGLELINEIKQHTYSLNTEILGAMLHQACYHVNFSYVLEIMELCLRENIQPNKIFMEKLVGFKKKCKKLSTSKEFSKSQEKEYRSFRTRYQTWINEVEVDESEDVHPWQQYRQTRDGETKYQWKDTARFKPRRTSRFKVKTSLKQRY